MKEKTNDKEAMRHEKENAPFLLDQTDFWLIAKTAKAFFLDCLADSRGFSRIEPDFALGGWLFDRSCACRPGKYFLSNYRTSPSGDPDHQRGQ